MGGAGGGHTIASGASIPPGTEERFLTVLDEIVGEQLRGSQEELAPTATATSPGEDCT